MPGEFATDPDLARRAGLKSAAVRRARNLARRTALLAASECNAPPASEMAAIASAALPGRLVYLSGSQCWAVIGQLSKRDRERLVAALSAAGEPAA